MDASCAMNWVRGLAAGIVALAAMGLVACAGDDSDAGGSPSTPEAAANQSVESALTLRDLDSSPEDEAKIGGMSRLYGELQQIVLLKQATALQSPPAGSVPTGAGAKETSNRVDGLDVACVERGEASVTYNNCSVASGTIDGTVAKLDDALVINLTITVDPSTFDATGMGGDSAAAGEAAASGVEVQSVTVTEQATLRYDDGSLTGTFDATVAVGMVTQIPMPGGETREQPIDMEQSVHAVFDVQLTTGCPTGGTLTVESAGTTAVATFGPECGDVTVE